jgi:hypothetical protein
MAKINQGYDCHAPIRDAAASETASQQAIRLLRSDPMREDALARTHRPHPGMCDMNNPICRAYVDVKVREGLI